MNGDLTLTLALALIFIVLGHRLSYSNSANIAAILFALTLVLKNSESWVKIHAMHYWNGYYA
jgi:hypothetical protein